MKSPAHPPLWTETAQDTRSERLEAVLSVILVVCLLAGATICGATICAQPTGAKGTIAAAAASPTPARVQTSVL